MKRLIITSIIAACFFITEISAQQSLSLSDAINIGLKNNYDLQITRQNEEIAGINNTWGNTGFLPNINFNMMGRENYNFNDQENYLSQTISPDLSLNWVFFNGFSANITKEKFEELEKQSQGNTAVLVESTIQDIILAYNNCLLQKEMTAVFKELSELSKDRYDRAKDAEDLGTGTTYESLQAKTSWLEDESNYLQQKVNYENAVRTLNFLIAVKDETEWSLSSELQTDTADYQLANLKTNLLAENQTLKNQYLYQSLLAKETALAKTDYYPTLSLNTGFSNTSLGNYYAGNTPDNSRNFSDAYIGVNLSFNIFNGGIRKRSVQIAQINEETAKIQTEQMEHSLTNQLLKLYSNYEVQKQLLTLTEEKLEAAKLNLELSRQKLDNGTINSFNYRDIQIAYINAALSKFNAQYSLIQTQTDLVRITGGIISEYQQ